MIRPCLVFLFASLLLTGCGETVTMPSTGTVYGEIVLENGLPASGLTVLVEHTGLSAVTDENGRFVINGVLAVDGSGMGRYYTVRAHGEIYGVDFGCLVDHFKVKGAQSYSVGRVVAKPTGVIEGTIHLEGTGDHSGVRVTVGGTTLEGYTAADGRFRIAGVPEFTGYHLPCVRTGYRDMDVDHLPGTDFPIRVRPALSTDLGTMTMTRVAGS